MLYCECYNLKQTNVRKMENKIMFDAITYIYQSENTVYPDKKTGKMTPCQLYVTISSAIVSKKEGRTGGYKELSIHGLRNPLPFTKIVVEEEGFSLDEWLYNSLYKYRKVGTVRHTR